MIRRRIVFFSTTALLLLISPMVSPAWRDSSAEMPPEGAVVETLRETPLRKSPPNEGLFYNGRGEQIGSAQPGDHFWIKAAVVVRKPLGNENWLCLQRLGQPSPQSSKASQEYGCRWAYMGSSGANFNLLVTP